MSSLQFPSNPVNGELYPVNPVQGETQYQFDAAAGTWRLIGTASGVIPGTYGGATEIPQFTVDASGRLTFAQNIPTSGLYGTLQTVTDNGNTTTNPIEIDINGASGLGFTVVNSTALPDRVEIHPTFVAVRNGYIQVEENGTQSIDINAIGTPRIQIRRDGYLSLGSGTTVFTERARINGQDGSARFDGQVVVENLTSNGPIRVFELGVEVAQVAATGSFFNELEIGGLNYPTADAPSGYVMTTDGLGNLTLQPQAVFTANTLQGVTDNGNTTTNDLIVQSSSNPTLNYSTVSPSLIEVNNGSVQIRTNGTSATSIVGNQITCYDGGSISLGTGVTPYVETLGFLGSSGVIRAKGTATLTPAYSFQGAPDSGLSWDTASSTLKLVTGGVSQVDLNGTTTTILSDLDVPSGTTTLNALIASSLNYPTTDGSTGEVLATDGAGNLYWSSGGGALVGNLQDVTNNGATTTNIIEVGGLNVDVSGNLVSSIDPTGIGTFAGGVIAGDISTGLGGLTSAGDLTVQDSLYRRFEVDSTTGAVAIGDPNIFTTGAPALYFYEPGSINPTITLTAAGGDGEFSGSLTAGSLVAAGITYPTVDGTANQFIATDGAGNLTFQSGADLQGVTNLGATTTNPIILDQTGLAGTPLTATMGTGSTALRVNGNGAIEFYTGPGGAYNSSIVPGFETLNFSVANGPVGGVLQLTNITTTLTNQLLATDGTSSLPSLSFTSDPATGFYISPTGELGITYRDSTRALISGTTISLNGTITSAGYLEFQTSGGTRFFDVSGTYSVSVIGPGTLTSNVILTLPTTPGLPGQYLTTDGFGTLSFTTPVAGTLQSITDSGATTTNPITVSNAVGGAAFTAINTASGRQTDIGADGINVSNGGIQLQTAGQPGINMTGSGTPNITVLNGGYISLGTGTTSYTETVRLNGNTGSATVASLVAGGLTYPTADGSAKQALATNGSGVIGWLNTVELVPVPLTSSSAGSLGQVAVDATHWYWHTGTEWRRIIGNTF